MSTQIPDQWSIQEPGKRTNCPRFTPAQADQFLATWCRVVSLDGSTVAYCPDATTGRLIAAAPNLLATLTELLDSVYDEGMRCRPPIETVDRARAVLREIGGGQ